MSFSMNGRGRALDNVFVQRLCRTDKCEEIYLRDYADIWWVEKSRDRARLPFVDELFAQA